MVGGDARSALALLQPPARKRYWRLVALQSATALQDLAGVLLFGVVGLMVVAVAQGTELPGAVSAALGRVGLADADPVRVALATALVAGLLLVAKSGTTLLVIRRVNLFLAEQSTAVSEVLVQRFLAQGLVRVQGEQSQRTATALSRGLSAAIVALLGSVASMISDLVLMAVLAGALLLIDPLLSMAAVAYFGAISWAIQRQRWTASRQRAVQLVHTQAPGSH